jgi:hypothetical protein
MPDYRVHVGNVLLTTPGQELAAIAGASADEEYRVSAVTLLRQLGWEVLEE